MHINGNTADDSKKAIDTITVNNPGKTYETSLRLGKGTFLIKVTLWDNALNPDGTTQGADNKPSGNKTELTKIITNNF